MKNMRGRILRKLKFISTPTWKQPQTSNLDKQCSRNHCFATPINEDFVMAQAPLDVKEDNSASGPNIGSQEKIVITSQEESVQVSESKPDEIGAVPMHDHEQSMSGSDPCSIIATSALQSSNIETEGKCPPGGRDCLVLYTTSLRGIRKTFEECSTIRFLLESFRVVYSERDVSMHLEYREELWGILGGRVVPPRLFVRGRYIGGADEVIGLHEKGMLKNLLRGIPLLSPCNDPCRGCGGIRFLLCCRCNGSRKVVSEERSNGTSSIRCPDCNENGLIKCSVCG